MAALSLRLDVRDDVGGKHRGSVTVDVCLVSASILHDLSDMQPQINAIKIEHPPYYCSSYTPPSAATAADHAQPAASFSPPPVHQLIRNDKTEKAPTVSVSSAATFSPVLRPEDGHRGMDSPHSQTGMFPSCER
ncbi:nuclear factor 1 X-type isoform X2 [Vespula squamosa]|uniref:Nuclear factor 1 X-type isoform X2 n=1 Tax=Vespula squamosa TaxID=30214 RepID=A0ABD2A5F6_VESSQ